MICNPRRTLPLLKLLLLKTASFMKMDPRRGSPTGATRVVPGECVLGRASDTLERGPGDIESPVDVQWRERGTDEPVVVGMQKHAAAYALGGEALVAIEVALVAKGEEGTGGRSGDLDLEPVTLRLGRAVRRRAYDPFEPCGRRPSSSLQGGQRLERGRHRHRAVPVAAGEEHLFRLRAADALRPGTPQWDSRSPSPWRSRSSRARSRSSGGTRRDGAGIRPVCHRE